MLANGETISIRGAARLTVLACRCSRPCYDAAVGNESSNNPLDYAPRPGLNRRWWKRVVLLLISGAIIGAMVQYGPMLWRQARQAYWFDRCLEFDAPSQTVVFALRNSSGTAGAPAGYVNSNKINWPPGTALFGGNGANQTGSALFGDNPDTKPTTDPDPPQLRFQFAPRCLAEYSNLQTNSPFSPSAIVFCHERTSQNGHRRLVVVKVDDDWNWHPADASTAMVLGLDGKLMQISGHPLNFDVVSSHPNVVSYFAGQVDSNNASLFTIEYVWQDGMHGLLLGRLNDDDSVDLAEEPGNGDSKHADIRRLEAMGASMKFRDP